MKDDYETDEKKQAAADVMFQYSKFVMACIGNQVRPCDLRFHLMKEISGIPTSLKRESSQRAASPDAMGESSSSVVYLLFAKRWKPSLFYMYFFEALNV
ncbi:uncharacterized protein LOC111781091 isoform X1 [Cucurbita pepo subsp. pepo]|uniref:uncharacterized protein LOC111781091 isoform X1 n=1 Tax=Cucurbita pepo subsp. pepo TaxID=3664 RepID=UPI000C9D411D|nr:uncharacterized protein LOC111781091 isoform X1 [Cucurbita pepo subsp. pepo]